MHGLPRSPLPVKLPRLIISDLDGTLLPESKEITAATLEVLGELTSRGVIIGLATGKFLHLTRPYGEALGPRSPLIALDGARTCLNGNEAAHHNRCIPLDVAAELLARYGDGATDMFLDNGHDELLMRFSSENFPHLIRHWASRTRAVRDAREHLEDDSGIIALYGPEDEMREVAAQARDDFPMLKVSFFASQLCGGGRVVFQPGGITKGTGILDLCADLDIDPSETMVFGDWYNDIGMFKAGCVNVAMANAVDEVKALAHHVTENDSEADGVARFLRGAFLDGR